MAEITNKKAQVDIQIKCGGQQVDIDPDIDVEVVIEKKTNRLSRAEVRCTVRNMPVADAYTFSENNSFKPGTDIEILAGFRNETAKSLFNGMIVKHGLSRDFNNNIVMELECVHKAIKMTTVRKTSINKNKTDSAIINTLIGNYSISKTVGSTSTSHKELVQYHCTDWDFMLSRAQANGMVVYTNTDKIEIEKPSLSGSAVVEVSDRDALKAFSTVIDGTNLFSTVGAQTWDMKSQAVTKSTSQAPSSGLGGNLSLSSLASNFNSSNFSLLETSGMASNDLKEWANSRRVFSELSRMQGTATITGNGDVQCGKLVKLNGISQRFAGNVFVGGLEHHLTSYSWTTEINIGLDYNWHFETAQNVDNKGAGGLLPTVNGLQIGKVTGIGNDSEGQYRVEIKLSADTSATFFARIANFYATNGAGCVFMPEVDDEVVVGFVDNDPRNAIILGSLYSSGRKPDLTINSENETKGIVTKNKMKITFDEKDKIIVIETPGGNKCTLDDKGTKIELVDSNKNKVLLDSSGIKLDTMKDITISAKGSVKISSVSGTTVESKGSLSLKGLNVSAEGQTAFEAKGNASAKIQSSGMLTVQGSLVKIN